MRVPHWKTAKKAVMTSSKQNFQYLRKNTFSFRRLEPPSVYVCNQYLNMCIIFPNYRYFRYFNGKLRNGRPKYGHIRHQRIQINNNHRFVFRFSQILCLTVFPLFSAAILDRRSEPRMLGYNPIQRHELKKKLTKFEEN